VNIPEHRSVVVKKPWGSEYLVYENENLGIWCLSIDPQMRTSLHCHPKKNTGFVVLNGTVCLQFLRGEMKLVGLDKIQIFRGRFHTTRCISEKSACVFEIEAPQDKYDLVRLEDDYGRVNSAYENSSSYMPRNEHNLWIEHDESYDFEGCRIRISKVTKQDLMDCPDNEILIFLRGGVYHDDNSGHILQPGDVVTGDIMKVLSKAFSIRNDTEILRIVSL
jgi:mannose-6-phosphate isomerase-like protein (cupin superfamily)